MSEAAPKWECDIHGMLPHPVEPRILMLAGGEGWALPHVRLREPVSLTNLGIVTQEMRKALDTDVLAYRYAAYKYEQERNEHRVDGVYVLDNLESSAEPPAGGRWIGRESLADLETARPEHKAVMEEYLTELESGCVPELRPPWARCGWHDRAASWIKARLVELGHELTFPVEQVSSWGISCVLRARTTNGDFYFKMAADLPLFVDEPALTEQLARMCPGLVPAPVAIDRERRWMLMEDFGQTLGDSDLSIETRKDMLRTFGRMQVESAGRVEELLAMGCIDRRLDWLIAQIDPLFETSETVARLDGTGLERLRRYAPRLKAMCEELADYNVPYALVHGDLHPGNVAVRDGAMVFFDWTDACVAHPFFDMLMIFWEEDEAVRTRMRDCYLELWTEYEPMERLIEAWVLAEKLYGLHQAVSYQYIAANMETRMGEELAGGIPFHLRQILQRMPLDSEPTD